MTQYDAMMAETVAIAGHGGDQIEAYLARPLSEGPRGGVVVIHHMPGFDEPTKDVAGKYAYHGYNAICPNLYSREPHRAPPDDPPSPARPPPGSPANRPPPPAPTPRT